MNMYKWMGHKTIRSYKNPIHKSRKAIWPEAQMWMIFKWYIKRQQRKNCQLVQFFQSTSFTSSQVPDSPTGSQPYTIKRPNQAPICSPKQHLLYAAEKNPDSSDWSRSRLTNQQPQMPKRHSPTFATVNKTTMLAKHFPPVARTLQLIQSFCWRLSSLLAKLDRF